MSKYLLAIDQGTTNSRAFIFSDKAKPISYHEINLTQQHPQLDWTEQDPNEMLSNTIICCREALKKSKLSVNQIQAMGITNQRETTIIWDKKTGQPIYPAIVWHDRRTYELCQEIAKEYPTINWQEKTGLLLDPYFSATKIIWILNNIPEARFKAENGELLFGTVDTFLLWHLTKGSVYATDATNASRTLLFNIKDQCWDQEILQALKIPFQILPRVLNSSDDFGTMSADILGCQIPIRSIIGDQQAATVGQNCFKKGMIKATYGTGCFLLLNTGDELIKSKNKLLATVAYRLNGKVTYGLEGSVFSAGTIIKWLRDKLKIISHAADSETIAQLLDNNGGVYLVPAFSGLGAPYWRPDVKAAILGLVNSSSREHIVRAGLEAVAYQTKDLLDAIQSDYSALLTDMRVDGGMSVNNWLLQFIADIIDLPIHRPLSTETTALGAALLAGLSSGLYQSLDEISYLWKMDREFLPEMDKNERQFLYQGWERAVGSQIQKLSVALHN
jgi:glycerol kinase